MARLCNFPISGNRRCAQPIADGRPNCGRHDGDSVGVSSSDLCEQGLLYYEGDLAKDPIIWKERRTRVKGSAVPEGSEDAGPAIWEVVKTCVRGPAVTEGSEAEDWAVEPGELHPDNIPAVTEWSEAEDWTVKQGERGRDDRPAVADYSEIKDWEITYELHREDGPAVPGGHEVLDEQLGE